MNHGHTHPESIVISITNARRRYAASAVTANFPRNVQTLAI